MCIAPTLYVFFKNTFKNDQWRKTLFIDKLPKEKHILIIDQSDNLLTHNFSCFFKQI